MDLKGWIVVILCVVGMVLYYPYMIREMERSRTGAQQSEAEKAETSGAESDKEPASPAAGAPSGEKQTRGEPGALVSEEIVNLASDEVEYRLTNIGGGIVRAALTNHAANLKEDGIIELNRFSSIPVGTLGEGAGEMDLAGFEVVRKSATEAVFEAVNAHGVRVRKRFYLKPENEKDGHVIYLDLTLENEGAETYEESDLSLFTGSVAPLHVEEWPQQAGFFYRDARHMRYRDINYFGKKGFLGFEFRGAREIVEEPVGELQWAGVMNQFFAIVVANVNPGQGSFWARRIPVKLNGQAENSGKLLHAAEAGFGLPRVELRAGETADFSFEIYMGPKEYARLVDLGKNRNEIMNYGSFPVLGAVVAPVSRFLVRALVRIEGVVGNFGVAILIITFLIRTLIWPLHAKSTNTMKRMAALSPMMTEMREKYKDDPQRLNQEMMKLYKDYGVNPFGGCLPVFLQLPIFLGFYRMLQSAVELRHESFLWVSDLSMPDTLFTIPIYGGLPFNALPLLMGITMLLQMKVAPKTGDKTQQRIFMFMPLIFLFICYNFASALALYWTAQNIFSIGQTYYMGRQPEPVLEKKKAKKGSFSDLMAQAKNRTKVAGQGPQQTISRAQQKKKRRK